MKKLEFDYIQKWIGEKLITEIDQKRKENGEVKRKRKLGTIELIWLFLNVALYSASMSLHEIIALAAADLDQDWKVSVPAFCKARMRFSPQAFLSYLGVSCSKTPEAMP